MTDGYEDPDPNSSHKNRTCLKDKLNENVEKPDQDANENHWNNILCDFMASHQHQLTQIGMELLQRGPISHDAQILTTMIAGTLDSEVVALRLVQRQNNAWWSFSARIQGDHTYSAKEYGCDLDPLFYVMTLRSSSCPIISSLQSECFLTRHLWVESCSPSQIWLIPASTESLY